VAEGNAWYAYTFFEPIDARRAFPCFDEPSFKIPWRLAIRVPRGQIALANAPETSRSDEAGFTRFEFAESKPLSSYQVAFVAGPFDVVEAGTVAHAPVPLRFVVPRGRGAETAWAASALPRIVALLEEALGVPFPYEKLDVAAVPRFWGTMEHPGLLALGQPLVLMKAGEDTAARRREGANVAAHELAHYWFGDLVTMAWWDDTWLAESFATWLDAKVTDAFEPAWRFGEEARAARRASAMDADALRSTKRVREPVRSRHDVEGAFDGPITYSKGAAVLSMAEAWLGEGKLQAIARRFLGDHAWKTATAADLYAAAEAEAGRDAARVLRSFVEQQGVPRITAASRCGQGPPRLAVSQDRFLAEPPGVPAAGTWAVPVCVRYGVGRREARTCAILDGPRREIPLDFCPAWVFPNAGGTGYYLSRLPLAPAGLLPRIGVAEKLALAADARLQAGAGDLPIPGALGLVPALAAENDPLLVEASVAMAELAGPRGLPDRERSRHRRFLRVTYGGRAKALGFLPRPGDADGEGALRDVLVPLVAGYGEEATLAGEAAALVRRWLSDRRWVPPEAAARALPVAARFADRDLFDRIVAAARAEEDRTWRHELLSALGLARDPELVRAALGLVLDGGFDLRDTAGILYAALGTREGREPAWDFLRRRFDDLTGGMRSDEVNDLVRAVGGAFCEPARRAEVAELLGPRVDVFDGAPRALGVALERIDVCAAAARRDGPAVSRFLSRY
jgi:aminopeptidase N